MVTSVVSVDVLIAERGLSIAEATELHISMLTMEALNAIVEGSAVLAVGSPKRKFRVYYKKGLHDDDEEFAARLEAAENTLKTIFSGDEDDSKTMIITASDEDNDNEPLPDTNDYEFNIKPSEEPTNIGDFDHPAIHPVTLSNFPIAISIDKVTTGLAKPVVHRKPAPKYEVSAKEILLGFHAPKEVKKAMTSLVKQQRDGPSTRNLTIPLRKCQVLKRPSSGNWFGFVPSGFECRQTRLPAASIVLGDFELKHYIGSGSQGSVYLATHKNNSQGLYAVKTVEKATLDAIDTRRALQEQTVMKKLKGHPYILDLSASFHDTRFFYLVTPYCGGGDLQELLFYHGTFALPRIKAYAAELIVALAYLEKCELFHRDLKLSNILLTRDGHIVLADFGVTESTRGSKAYCGTVMFMAPEVLTGKIASTPSDVWSLGICLWAMWTALPPWFVEEDDDNLTETRLGIINDSLPGPGNLDPILYSLCEEILQKEPSRRPTYSRLQEHPLFSDVDWVAVENREAQVVPSLPIPDDGPILAAGTLSERYTLEAGDPIPEDQDDCPGYTFSSDNFPPPIELSRPAVYRSLLPSRSSIASRPLFPPTAPQDVTMEGEESQPLNETTFPTREYLPMDSETSAFGPSRLDGVDFASRFSWGQHNHPIFRPAPPKTHPEKGYTQDMAALDDDDDDSGVELDSFTTMSSLSAFVTVDLGLSGSFTSDFGGPETDLLTTDNIVHTPPSISTEERLPKVLRWVIKTSRRLLSYFRQRDQTCDTLI